MQLVELVHRSEWTDVLSSINPHVERLNKFLCPQTAKKDAHLGMRKDRMAVEPLVRLTRPEVIEVLSKMSLVVHTLVPEKYRFWTSNQQGVCCHPVAICPGPLGSILALDYDLNTSCSRLLKILLRALPTS